MANSSTQLSEWSHEMVPPSVTISGVVMFHPQEGFSFKQTSWKSTLKAWCKHHTFSTDFGGAHHWLVGPGQNKKAANCLELIACLWTTKCCGGFFCSSCVVFLSSLIKFVVGRFRLGLWLMMEAHRRGAARTYGSCSCTFCEKKAKQKNVLTTQLSLLLRNFSSTKQLRVVALLGSA